MSKAARQKQADRCSYVANSTDYRCTHRTGHDGAHYSKSAARLGEPTWTCRCADCPQTGDSGSPARFDCIDCAAEWANTHAGRIDLDNPFAPLAIGAGLENEKVNRAASHDVRPVEVRR